MGGAAGLGHSLDRWLDRDRCIAWSGGLLAFEALVFLLVVAWAHGLVGPVRDPAVASFVSFYAAGRLADGANPAAAYDPAAHEAAEDAARIPGIPHPVFTYPPVYLLVCAPLALLPYLPAFLAFQAITLAALLGALRRILAIEGWGARVWLPCLAFPALWENLALGQNAFLTAALFAWGLVLLPTRPLLAGLVLGALCYKPHFGVLLPVALAAGRHWRAMAGAALSVAALVGLSVAAFGVGPWLAYKAALPAMPSFYASGHIAFAAMVSPMGATLLLGWSAPASAVVQGVSALAAAVAVGWVWRRGHSPALRAAVLLAGTLLAAPLLLFYDQLMALVAIAFLVRHARRTGWLAQERPLLGAIVGLSLVAPVAAIGWGLPLGPLPAIMLLGLCLAHARLSAPARHHARSARTPEVAGRA